MSADKKLKELAKKLEKLPDADYQFLADKVAAQIKKRTKTGKGVDNSGNLYKLPDLSEGYVETRKKNRSKLGEGATPKKSNLTASGKMLNSIKATFRRAGGQFRLIFELTGSTKGLGSKSQKTADVAKWQADDQGRRFFDLSKTEQNGILREVRNKIRDLIAKNFNK
jgi:hypothetical protein